MRGDEPKKQKKCTGGKQEAWLTFSRLISRAEQVVIKPHPPRPTTIRWRGSDIALPATDTEPFGNDLQRAAKQIAWEVSEVAFRIELAELDRVLLPGQDPSISEELLGSLFPSKVFSIPDMPPPAQHLGAAACSDRWWK